MGYICQVSEGGSGYYVSTAAQSGPGENPRPGGRPLHHRVRPQPLERAQVSRILRFSVLCPVFLRTINNKGSLIIKPFLNSRFLCKLYFFIKRGKRKHRQTGCYKLLCKE